jgi:ATP-dependent DNA ligase
MLYLAVARLPEGPSWSYEIKFDSYRAIGSKSAGRFRLFSGNGKDFTQRFCGLETERGPFANLPETRRGHWGEGLTAEEMENCRWLKPRLVATIEYLEWTAANYLRHARFAGLMQK